MTKQKLQPEEAESATDNNRSVERSDVGRPWVGEII